MIILSIQSSQYEKNEQIVIFILDFDFFFHIQRKFREKRKTKNSELVLSPDCTATHVTQFHTHQK